MLKGERYFSTHKGGFLAINTFTVIPGSAARDFTPYPATNPEKGRPLLDLMQEILDDMVKDRHITQVCVVKKDLVMCQWPLLTGVKF